jgi:hypothetical protein
MRYRSRRTGDLDRLGAWIADIIGDKLGSDRQSRPADNEASLELLVKEFRNHVSFISSGLWKSK